MPLHRDIHWIGRQWAVTGHGMQLIDQKLQGFFDIEVSRLWDDGLIESMHAKEWLNAADFDKGLAIARARHPQPPGAQTPRQAAPVAAIQPVTPLEPAVKPIERKPETPKLEIPKPVAPILPKPASVEQPRTVEELKTPAIATRAPLEPPAAVTSPRQAAPPTAIEPAASLSPVVKPAEPKRGPLKLGVPEPVKVTLIRRGPVETPTAVVPPPQAAPPPSAVHAAPLPPAIERDASKPVVPTLIKPGSVEPGRAVAEPLASAIATHASSVEPLQPPSLFQMRYQCRARFVRPWRVVVRRKT
jgi:hypothetical protein